MTTTTRKKRYGLKKHALTILKFEPVWYDVEFSYLDGQYTCSYEDLDNWEALPEGWKFAGVGVSRAAYIGPDGLIYKVPKGGYSLPCETEAQRYETKGALFASQGVHLARAYWHEDVGVLTMEFCDKSRDYTDDESRKIASVTGLYDIHPGNAWVDKQGRLIMVDYVA